MKREEASKQYIAQVLQNSKDYLDCDKHCKMTLIQKAFEDGMEWAYEHLYLNEEEQVGMGGLGMMWQKQALINKAAKWIVDNIDLYAYKLEKKDFPPDFPLIERIVMIEDFYNDFKAAMEE